MLDNSMILTEAKHFSLYCTQDGQKNGRKNSETFQDTPVERSIDSEASGEESPLVE